MKKPRPDGGVFLGSMMAEKSIARVDPEPPKRELFSTTLPCRDSRSLGNDGRPRRACQCAEKVQPHA